MSPLRLFSATLLVLVTALVLAPLLATAADLRSYHNSLEARYARAHSLSDNYQFNTQDGWMAVNISNLAYKYKRDDSSTLEDLEGDGNSSVEDEPGELVKRAFKKSKSHTKSKTHSSSKAKPKAKSASKAKPKSKPKTTTSVKPTSNSDSDSATKGLSSLQKIVDSIKGIGKAEPVTITWYTGHDLLNPSCWSNTNWAPSDQSFAAALTLTGWTTKPKCFKFLELCHTPKKCVFVRVVDSCAGCAEGSKHVDLTQAAFKELADLDTGLLTVQMRQATDPTDGWLENLWGPKA